ncbi:MAG: FkbM family methyltransferase [candidate division Zixibacteria bacterium]|nr:FkbM family methyltransferase [candidate division Zixibacteria bacterium]
MIKNSNSLLYRRLKAKGFRPSHVAEIGVWHPQTSNVYQYIQDSIRTTLVEPEPISIAMIKSEFMSLDNVTLYECALCDFNGQVELCQRGSSTFVSTLSASPAIVNDNYDVKQSDKFTAEAKLFSEIDDGTIDFLSVDTEGSEWFVIKHMTSRPAVISIETHGGMYVNPYLDKLQQWMDDNNYVLWYKDKSDSVFVLSGTISVSFIDRIRHRISNLTIAFKARKKRFGKIISKLFE